jgi:cysteinyl-tRNA synthetase
MTINRGSLEIRFWIMEEDPAWLDNFKLKYWEKEWHEIFYGNHSYLKKIFNTGLDGAYLDIIDAFGYCEIMYD